MNVSTEALRDIHLRMVRIRTFEEEAGKLMESGKVPGSLHLYVGEEAVAAGVMAHLRDSDQITSTHRGHGHLVAKGGDFKQMYAELFGRSTGYCKGKGGSMHISDLDLGMLGANGIVGAGPPIAIGAAFSNQYRKTDNVTVCFFGDGASNEGTFHEAANMAAVFKLPVVFVCENNGFGEFTRQERHQAIQDVADRASGYGMPGVVVDGMDVMAVYEAAGEAIMRARRGGGRRFSSARPTASTTTWAFADSASRTGMTARCSNGANATPSRCSNGHSTKKDCFPRARRPASTKPYSRRSGKRLRSPRRVRSRTRAHSSKTSTRQQAERLT